MLIFFVTLCLETILSFTTFAYISKGFSNWKKAPKCFAKDQETTCHRIAAAYFLVVSECEDVGDMIDKNTTQIRKVKQRYLDVIKCLRYLSRQGIALQGHDENDNFTQLLRLLGTKDENILKQLDDSIGHKYTHHDFQNEILHIMASQVLRSKLANIRKCHFFSVILDEYTDDSNVEQLSFCLGTVDEKLNVRSSWILRVRQYTKLYDSECCKRYFTQIHFKLGRLLWADL